MPLYEYGCPACGKISDVRHGFDEKPELACEACGAALVRRFSAAPIVFKGSGFYVTDSRSKSSGSEKSETKTESKPETKSDAKPEKKAEPSSTPSPKKDDAAA